ncbi:hypothetical protein F5884DRAFT_382847 [Xylogone sp. PMI_703]|nr:hypothetical protein F5884DRAFT_382847 [Xylogone sp. PMI_703]
MATIPKKVVLILGGAGAQNGVVAKKLSEAGTYNIHVLTRSVDSSHAAELGALPNVKLIEGDCYDEDALVPAFHGVDLCFVNTNGFAIGEKNEIYWGIRMYEIARWAGVKHFIYSSLPYVSKNGNFDPKRRVPFVDGKAKVAEFLHAQPLTPMVWSVIESGPYAERLWDSGFPNQEPDGSFTLQWPLGPTGAMPLVALDDFAWYTQWMFEHPKRTAGLHLGVGIAHITGEEIAKAFQKRTGKTTKYKPQSIEEYVGRMPKVKIGAKASPGYDDPTLKTPEGHFVPWWGIWADSGGNTGCWQRDYALLDEIMPHRIKTLDEWMERANYTGQPKQILKTGLN